MGDDGFGTRITAPTSFGTVNIDVIVFRTGTVDGVLGTIGGSIAIIGSGQVDPTELEAIANAADAKVAAVLR